MSSDQKSEIGVDSRGGVETVQTIGIYEVAFPAHRPRRPLRSAPHETVILKVRELGCR